jgi:hypothetical protein
MLSGIDALTFVHVAISLVAIASGLVVVYSFLAAKRLDVWTALFLSTTVLTSATGFLFPITGFTPALAVGIVSLIILAVALAARYRFRLAGRWRAICVISSVTALYLNVFVLVVQLYQKVPTLHALAPTQTEPVFLATQLVVLLLFVVLGIGSVIRFRSPLAPA